MPEETKPLGWSGVNPRTADGLQTLAAVITQWEPTPTNRALVKALRETSAQLRRYEEAVDAAIAEYEEERWTEDTQGALAECQEEAT